MSRPQRVCSTLLLIACVLTGVLVYQRPAAAYPKPSMYPVAWELKFKHSVPKRITFKTPDEAAPVAYWYMTFTVTNKTEEKQLFLPTFDLFTRDGKNIEADKGVPAALFDEIRKQERNESLQSLLKVAGELLVGDDQTKEGVAIWVEPSPRMGTFHIFVGGLSGEAVITEGGEEKKVKDWTKVSEEDRKKQNILRKTADLTFQVSGDGSRPSEEPAHAVKEDWVMR